MDIENVKLVLDIILATASVLILIVRFLNNFFDYKFTQRMSKMGFNMKKKNRCSSHKGSNGKI